MLKVMNLLLFLIFNVVISFYIYNYSLVNDSMFGLICLFCGCFYCEKFRESKDIL